MIPQGNPKIQRLDRLSAWGFLAALSAICFGSVSCTNSLSAKITGSAGATTNQLNNTVSLITVTNVLFDNTSPSTTLDVFGDGSNSMATYCTPSGGLNQGSSSSTSATDGTSNCACSYTFTSNNITETIEADTVYHESNMIECSYTGIPTGVSSVNVSVYLITQQQNSNTFDFSLTSTGTTSATTNISNFAKVGRYQCSDAVTIPYAFGPALGQANSIYDPILSDQSGLNYPLDFYTTNFGQSYGLFVGANLPGQCSTSSNVNNCVWTCPSNPANSTNLNLYSVGPDTNDGNSYQIYPNSGGGEDRSTFYVSQTANGVFNVPLNTYIAPTMIAEAFNPNGAPSGYGAQPISTGSGTEECPANNLIPPGYQWVKVWLFRADLPDRTYPMSNAMINASSIACNPGYWASGSDINKPIFADCNVTNQNDATSALFSLPYTAVGTQGPQYSLPTLMATVPSPSPAPLADRVIAGEGNTSYNLCVNMNVEKRSNCAAPSGSDTCQGPGATTSSATSDISGTQINNTFYGSFGVGTDIWEPEGQALSCPPTGGGLILDASVGTTSSAWSDPLGICASNPAEFVPHDNAPVKMDLDSGQTRYDFVFVVTPPSVESGLMEKEDPSVYAYIPVRWPNAADCQSPDPNNPQTVGDCPQNKIIQYGLQLQDIETSGAPNGSTTAPVIYPMCAIQPIP